MVNSPRNHLKKKVSTVSGDVKEVQRNSATFIQEILDGMSATEEFIGKRFIGIIQGLEGEQRNVYTKTITHPETMKPLIGQMLASFQIDEKISVSRVIAYIQAYISQF